MPSALCSQAERRDEKVKSNVKKIFSLIALGLLLTLIAGGCLIIKDDRGRHRGHYKQGEKR
jgi:hypothetical protein